MNRATFVVTLRTPFGDAFQATRVPTGSLGQVVERWAEEGRFNIDTPNAGPITIELAFAGTEPAGLEILATEELLELESTVAREKAARGLR